MNIKKGKLGLCAKNYRPKPVDYTPKAIIIKKEIYIENRTIFSVNLPIVYFVEKSLYYISKIN